MAEVITHAKLFFYGLAKLGHKNKVIPVMGGLHIIESAMGYRGSKSVTDLKMAVHQIKSLAVKEQRVDGS